MVSITGLTFQSTHSRGVRRHGGRVPRVDKKFQSTHSRGVRHYWSDEMLEPAEISIHALTRSATPSLLFLMCASVGFQSTHSRGVRRKWFKRCYNANQFQSTHSRGVRLETVEIPLESTIISIHALTRSATYADEDATLAYGISIHALTRSATRQILRAFTLLDISIHALTRSATKLTVFHFVSSLISIHALTRSATPCTMLAP